MTNPWIKFYPSDWRADPALRMCSLGARGLWMEMLCIMHEASGSLEVNGKALQPQQLAILSGCSLGEVTAWLSELEDAGVFSRDETGTIYSRRMRKDIAKAEEDKANGRKGGNPRLKGGVNPPVNPTDKGEDKAQKPEARSQTPDNSETKVSGVTAENSDLAANVVVLSDPRADLFGRGLKILTALTGRPEGQLRGLLGKWLKAANDDAVKVLRIVEDAARSRVADAVPWIEAALKDAPKPKSTYQTEVEKMRRWL